MFGMAFWSEGQSGGTGSFDALFTMPESSDAGYAGSTIVNFTSVGYKAKLSLATGSPAGNFHFLVYKNGNSSIALKITIYRKSTSSVFLETTIPAGYGDWWWDSASSWNGWNAISWTDVDYVAVECTGGSGNTGFRWEYI